MGAVPPGPKMRDGEREVGAAIGEGCSYADGGAKKRRRRGGGRLRTAHEQEQTETVGVPAADGRVTMGEAEIRPQASGSGAATGTEKSGAATGQHAKRRTQERASKRTQAKKGR